jgi:hypothetical protein
MEADMVQVAVTELMLSDVEEKSKVIKLRVQHMTLGT